MLQNLSNILQQSASGQDVGNYYSMTKILGEEQRKTLLTCIVEFYYDSIENSYNIPSPKTMDRIAEDIVKLFPSESKGIWNFFLTLLKIVDIVFITKFTSDTLKDLENLIEQHPRMYIDIFKNSLKPKFHILNHYVRTITQSGPVKHLWSYLFESKHREAKTYARNITSRKNITYSLSIKASLKFSNFLMDNQRGFPSYIEFVECDNLPLKETLNINNIINIEEFEKSFNFESCFIIQFFTRVHYIKKATFLL